MAPKEASPKVQRSQTIDQPDQVLPDTPKPEFKIPDGFRDIATETFLIFLAAITSRVSQLSLAPVYGSIPSSVNHQAAIGAVALIGWSSQWTFRHNNAPDLQSLPLWAVCAPILTCISFQFSDSLGLTWGPIVGGLLSCYSIILPMMYAAAASHEGSSGSSGPLVHLLSGIPSLGLFMILDWAMADTVNTFVATWSFLNPFNAQLIAGLYMLFALTDRRTIITATVSIATIAAIISPYGNGPFSTIALDASLAPQNWTLLSREWSNTGYLSVLENSQANYRVMRCDHSLLGGEWQLTPARRAQGWKIPESIYAAFHMLEAVRLMETEPAIQDSEAQALIIGLGIGTAPKAFIGHGINTTIVELDPVVHRFATDYFGLPANHTAVLSDAIAWVKSEAHPEPPIDYSDEPISTTTFSLSDILPAAIAWAKGYPDEIPTDDPSSLAETPAVLQYDYILHDVFTGGAEPLPLFTREFLADLRALLKPHGVAALNYAGDLTLPLTAKVLNTIDLAFDRNCALYRDSLPEEDPAEGSSSTFANYILFCRNAPGGSLAFREPDKGDYLESLSRRQHLFPRAEYKVGFPLRGAAGEGKVEADLVLTEEEVRGGKWKREQEESAGRHWGIMRVVLPGWVWGLY
jgi:hypothetical protein